MRKFLLLGTLLLLNISCMTNNEPVTQKIILPNGVNGTLRKENKISQELETYNLEFKSGLGEKKSIKAYKMGNIYLIPGFQIKNGKLVPIRPKSNKIPVDVSFLEKIDRNFQKLHINNISGKKGGPKVYFIFDAYCPYCIADFKNYYEKLAKKYEIHFIPFAIHGERSVKLMACMFNDMKRLPADNVLKTYFSNKNHLDLLKHCDAKETEKLIKEISSILRRNFVRATPTFVYQYKDGKFKVKVGAPTPLITPSPR